MTVQGIIDLCISCLFVSLKNYIKQTYIGITDRHPLVISLELENEIYVHIRSDGVYVVETDRERLFYSTEAKFFIFFIHLVVELDPTLYSFIFYKCPKLQPYLDLALEEIV